jgi:protein-S-isoprenylcysteine O-methyltransferase Ste14
MVSAALCLRIIAALWAIWLVGWLTAALNVKRTRWKEPRATAVYNRLPVLVGMVMLVDPHWLPAALSHRFMPPGPLLPFIGTILVGAGLAFTGWARWHLGRNWSGNVTVKEGHTLVRTGPYRLVRHPIYTGIVVALLGTALAIGAAYGFIAAALILIGFIAKLSVEEARMRETFPEYTDYCRHTARLVPGVY